MKEPSSVRQQAIIQAALICFSRHGVEATTIDMIREASGASVGSLYHHFGNKEGIAAEVFVQGLRDFRLHMQSGLATATTLQEAVTAIVYANVDWISANPDWASFIFNHRVVLAQASREAEFNEEGNRLNEAGWARLSALPGAEQLSPLAANIYPSLISGPVHEYASHWLAGRRKTPLIELRELFAKAAYASLLACC